MSEDHVNSIRILRKAQEEKRYTKLVLQLLKDFQLANVSLGITLLVTPEEVKSAVHEKVYYLHMEKFDDYLNLMYVVDVPENAFKNGSYSDVVDFTERATYHILRRELEKVRLKEEYD